MADLLACMSPLTSSRRSPASSRLPLASTQGRPRPYSQPLQTDLWPPLAPWCMSRLFRSQTPLCSAARQNYLPATSPSLFSAVAGLNKGETLILETPTVGLGFGCNSWACKCYLNQPDSPGHSPQVLHPHASIAAITRPSLPHGRRRLHEAWNTGLHNLYRFDVPLLFFFSSLLTVTRRLAGPNITDRKASAVVARNRQWWAKLQYSVTKLRN